VKTLWSNFWTKCGTCRYSNLFGDAVGPSCKLLLLFFFGLLGCVPGESSTQTLFLRVMDTFDDDDDVLASRVTCR
jgi:hypothetical protein